MGRLLLLCLLGVVLGGGERGEREREGERGGERGGGAIGVVDLSAYNVDIEQTSVSGLSSGGFFAVQMHIAFSSIMQGAGLF